MAEHSKTDIKIDKIIYSNSSINKVINRSFSELTSENPPVDVKGFFNQYNKIFYDIPKLGAKNSHFTLVEQSTEYLEGFEDPRDEHIESLMTQIEGLEEELDLIQELSLDSEHPFIPNGAFIVMKSGGGYIWPVHYMDKGYRRALSSNSFDILKKLKGLKDVKKFEDITTILDPQTFLGIKEGPPLETSNDLNNIFDPKAFREKGGLGDQVVETYSMGRISNRAGATAVVYLGHDDRPPKDTIKKNDIVEISNTSFDGKYLVPRIAIATDNKISALYLNITNYTPTGPVPPPYNSSLDDYTFNQIGLISLLK